MRAPATRQASASPLSRVAGMKKNTPAAIEITHGSTIARARTVVAMSKR
jgi:hypothetical protein